MYGQFKTVLALIGASSILFFINFSVWQYSQYTQTELVVARHRKQIHDDGANKLPVPASFLVQFANDKQLDGNGNVMPQALSDLPCEHFHCRYVGPLADDVPGLGDIGSFTVKNDVECANLCDKYRNCASFEYSLPVEGMQTCHLDTKSTRTGLKYGAFGLYVRRTMFRRDEIIPNNWGPVLGGNTRGLSLNQWIDQELPKIPRVPLDPLSFVLGFDFVDQEGEWLEFGVFQGNTANQIAAHRIPNAAGYTKVYGFDSFQGLPEDWHIGVMNSDDANARTILGSTFDLHGGLPIVSSNVELVKGWFNESTPVWLKDHGDSPITLLHVDCDLYTSSATVFREIGHLLVPGSVIVFDELINFPAFRKHEIRALFEFLDASQFTFEWLGTPCGVDSVLGMPVGSLEGDGYCLAVAIRLGEKRPPPPKSPFSGS